MLSRAQLCYEIADMSRDLVKYGLLAVRAHHQHPEHSHVVATACTQGSLITHAQPGSSGTNVQWFTKGTMCSDLQGTLYSVSQGTPCAAICRVPCTTVHRVHHILYSGTGSKPFPSGSQNTMFSRLTHGTQFQRQYSTAVYSGFTKYVCSLPASESRGISHLYHTHGCYFLWPPLFFCV